MTVFEDLAAEQDRLEGILAGLSEGQWEAASAADGWTVADVVLHLAQSEEAVQATMTGGDLRTGFVAATGNTMDERAESAVRAERAAPGVVFERWRRARPSRRSPGRPGNSAGWPCAGWPRRTPG